jgi:hypothetical protein
MRDDVLCTGGTRPYCGRCGMDEEDDRLSAVNREREQRGGRPYVYAFSTRQD